MIIGKKLHAFASMGRLLSLSIVLSFGILFLSGCIDMNIEQELKEDRSSDVVIEYDFSAFISYFNDLEDKDGFGNEDDFKADDILKKACANESNRIGFDCSVTDENKVTLRGNWQVSSEFFEVKKKLTEITYTYDALGIFELLDELDPNPDFGGFSSTDDHGSFVETLPQLKTLGAKISYTVTLPATVESSEVGIVNGNKVTIDVFDLSGRDSAVIVASKDNTLIYYIFATLAGVAVFLIVTIIIVSRKNA